MTISQLAAFAKLGDGRSDMNVLNAFLLFHECQ